MEEVFSDYQVFINHRGPDTKNTLVSLLYHALRRSGLRVFLDREELPTGNCVSPQIKAAIFTSSVHIVIFSPTYADSEWCLQELCLTLQQRCRTTIIPIFCDVEPSELRRVQKGQYAEAFKKHKDRGIMQVERWEEALRKAADIKGHVFHTREGDWGKFVYEIVDIVQKKVRKEPLVGAEHPVGLKRATKNLYKEILKQIDPNAGTNIVGIAGLDGSGKTTLVTHLYNLKHSHFKRFSFLCEVSQSKRKLTSLQERLLFDLLGCSQLHIGSTKEGKSLLVQRLKGLSRVLIVLDDIDDQEQIDSLLLPVKDVLVDGSLIVITSRDKDILARCQVGFLYNMKLLNERDARELFLYYAFRDSKAETLIVSDDLVRDMVKICGGYPLASKVLGAQLFGKPKSYWISLLKSLQNNQFPNEIVQKIVKVSYDSLEAEAKAAFLHVASLFEGLDTHLVVRFQGLVECPLLDWIETLGQKCLVEFHCVEVDVNGQIKYNDGGNEDFWIHNWIPTHVRSKFIRFPYRDCKIRMHKLVKDMAKKIANEEPPLYPRFSENQIISSAYKISDSLQQLPKGITAPGKQEFRLAPSIQEFVQLKYLLKLSRKAPPRFIIGNDCIQEYQHQLKCMKLFIERFRECMCYPSIERGSELNLGIPWTVFVCSLGFPRSVLVCSSTCLM